jgi:hypothetical protein
LSGCIAGGLISCRRRRGAAFFASPGRWTSSAVKRYQLPISKHEVSCHDEIVLVTSEKQGTSASADSANDAVPGDESVRVPQDLINGKEFKGIELRIGYKSVLALARALN